VIGRLSFFGQEEVDIQLRTKRGSSPRRLVPWWACVASGKHSVRNAPQHHGTFGTAALMSLISASLMVGQMTAFRRC